MNKLLRGIRVLLMALSMMAMLFSMLPANVHAEEKCFLITYRSGEVGTFNVDRYKANHNAGNLIDASEYYLTFKVRENAAYPELPLEANGEIIIPGNAQENVVGNYYVVNWGPEATTVTRSEEYVVDYGKLLNPTQYSVYYLTVDAKGNEVEVSNALLGARGNIGEEVVFAKSISGYRFSKVVRKDGSESRILEADASNNVFMVYYIDDSSLSGEVIEHRDGGSTIEYQDGIQTIVYLPGTTTVVQGSSNVAIGGNAAVPSVTQVNTANINGENNNGDNFEINEAQEQQQDNGVQQSENVNIQDENTPLADQADEQNTGEMNESVYQNIVEEEVPNAPGIDVLHNYYPIFITAGVIAVLACVVAVVLYKRKKVE